MSVHGDEDRGGSISPETPQQSPIAATEATIEAVGEEIRVVEKKVEAVEAALSGGPAYLGISDSGVLLEERQQLWKKEEQLREKELLLLSRLPKIEALALTGTQVHTAAVTQSQQYAWWCDLVAKLRQTKRKRRASGIGRWLCQKKKRL